MIAESCVELSKLIMEVVEFNHATCLPSLASVSPPPRSRIAALLSASGAMWLNPNRGSSCEPTSVLNSITFSVAAFFLIVFFFPDYKYNKCLFFRKCIKI